MRSPLNRLSLALCLVLCLNLSGCGLLIGHLIRSSEHEKQVTSQVTASLARYRQFALDGDAERLADLFVRNGELSHDDAKPVVGRPQIRDFLKGFAGWKIQDYTLQASTTTVKDAEVTQHGTYTQVVTNPQGTVLRAAGDFDATWLHQVDGRWLLLRMHTQAPAKSG